MLQLIGRDLVECLVTTNEIQDASNHIEVITQQNCTFQMMDMTFI